MYSTVTNPVPVALLAECLTPCPFTREFNDDEPSGAPLTFMFFILPTDLAIYICVCVCEVINFSSDTLLLMEYNTEKLSWVIKTLNFEHGVSRSLRRNRSLDCLHRARSARDRRGQVDPGWRVEGEVFAPSSFGRLLDRFQGLGLHSVALIVHLLSVNLAMCSAQLFLFRVMAVTMSSISVCWRIQVLRF